MFHRFHDHLRYTGAFTIFVIFATLALAALLAGCGTGAETTLDPAPAGNVTEFGLGPGVRSLSSGPGYKGSPVWSNDGQRVAFTIDGYVVDRSTGSGERKLWTTRDFDARAALWDSGNSVGILGSTTEGGESDESTSNTPGARGEASSLTLYRSSYVDGSPDLTEVASGITSVYRIGFGEATICAIENDSRGSDIALIRDGQVAKVYGDVDGRVEGISLSPNGNQAALAVRLSGDSGDYEVQVMNLSDGSSRAIARLSEGSRVFGSPQWANDGVYYVAGSEEDRQGGGGALYRLYRARLGSDSKTPRLAPGVGSDFTASSIQVSPDGGKLAIVGRLRPSTTTNLHVLDLASENLRPLTSNEDMEIKGGSDDLSWSPDGQSIAIVARGAFSGPRVRPEPPDALLEEFFNVYAVPLNGEEP